MRSIREIIIHCTATPWGRDHTAADIDRWHRERGFQGIGYHYLIRRDGTLECGRPLEKAGAHCHGHNAHSIGIAYVGGLDPQGRPADTRTPRQQGALRTLVAALRMRFPHATVHGHNELNPHKACPCFSVKAEL